MGELFSSLNTFPEVVIMPDVKKAVVEELLGLYSRRWEEKEISLEVREAANLLGLPLSNKNKQTSQSELLGLPILTQSELNKDNSQTNEKVSCDSMTNTPAHRATPACIPLRAR